MGVDLLDITFRLEKRFAIRLQRGALSSLASLYDGRPDLTAADVAALVTRLLGREPPAAASAAVPPARDAGQLNYESRVGGPWPPPPPFDPAVWPGVCQVLSAALGVPASDIVPQSRLVRDLGMC